MGELGLGATTGAATPDAAGPPLPAAPPGYELLGTLGRGGMGVGDEPWGIIVLRRSDIEGPQMKKRRESNEGRAAKRAAKKATSAEVSTVEGVKHPAVNKAPAVKKLAKANGAVSKRPARRLAAVS